MDVCQFLYCGKLLEFYWDKEADGLVDVLAVPVKPGLAQSSSAAMYPDDNSRKDTLQINNDLKQQCQTPLCLAALLDELILTIFRSLDLLSYFRLSLVSKRFWKTGWPFFLQKITELMCPWAGKRIICFGDECDFENLPAGFLTREEENIVNEGLADSEIDPEEGPFEKPGNLLDIALCRFQEVHSKVEPFEILNYPLPGEPESPIYEKSSQNWRSPRNSLQEAKHLPEPELSQVHLFASGSKRAMYYPETESWILRNLTTAEFVCGNRLFTAFQESGRQHGPHLGYPGFGEAVMCRICWSTNSSSAPHGFNRGVWAGHRFEICTEKMHAAKSNCGWRDVTSEIISELSVALELPLLTKESERIKDEW